MTKRVKESDAEAMTRIFQDADSYLQVLLQMLLDADNEQLARITKGLLAVEPLERLNAASHLSSVRRCLREAHDQQQYAEVERIWKGVIRIIKTEQKAKGQRDDARD